MLPKTLSHLAATSARLARINGALPGLVSKALALPGMFAPTNQELACVRKILAPVSAACLTQASSEETLNLSAQEVLAGPLVCQIGRI